MRVLFDQGTPVPPRETLTQHEVATAYERGWSKLKNGELLDAAEGDGFEVFVTTDTRLRYQQNLAARRIAVVCLLSTSWPRINRNIGAVVSAIDSRAPASYTEVSIPRRRLTTSWSGPESIVAAPCSQWIACSPMRNGHRARPLNYFVTGL